MSPNRDRHVLPFEINTDFSIGDKILPGITDKDDNG